jgi:hypothetical protein
MDLDLNLDERDVSEEALAAERKSVTQALRLWTRRAGVAGAAFFLSCASVVPFLYGHALHAHWESFGKYLVLVVMGLLIPLVISVGIAISVWMHARELEKGEG